MQTVTVPHDLEQKYLYIYGAHCPFNFYTIHTHTHNIFKWYKRNLVYKTKFPLTDDIKPSVGNATRVL